MVNDELPVEGFFEGASILDALKSDYDEIRREQDEGKFIPILGYERTGLRAKYRVPENSKELDRITKKVMREYKTPSDRNLFIGMDTMINLCVGLYVQPPENSEPVPLDLVETGVPVRFDETLADGLGWENIKSARQVVRKLFADNELAITTHAEVLFRWLRKSDAALEAEFLESGEI